MPRTRSVLVDNTIGRIFRNVSTVSQATAASVIAGDKLAQRLLNGGTSNIRVQNNVGGRGLFFIGGALVTQLIFSNRFSSRGSPVVINVKKGTTYALATLIGNYEIPPLTAQRQGSSATFAVSITLAAGESLFFDVVSVGNVFPGTGLSILAGFYTA